MTDKDFPSFLQKIVSTQRDDVRIVTAKELEDSGVLFVQDGNHGNNRPRKDEFVEKGVPFIRPPDLRDGQVSFDKVDQINETAFKRIRKGIARPKDVLLTTNATIGRIALTGLLAPEVFVVNPQITVWRTNDESFLDHRYLYYFMRDRAFMGQLWSLCGDNSTFNYVNLTLQKGMYLAVPSIKRQKAIAHILGTLDDKIELNQKMNQTLEEIAKAIFKSWFVDFDPVRAKAEGRPTGLSREISDLFPDELVDSGIGEIPTGWNVTNVGEITSKETLKVKKFSEEVKVLSAVSSGHLRLSEEYFTKQVFSKNIDNYYVVPKFSFAYNPSRINIGSIGLNLFNFSGAVSPVYSVFTAREGMHWYFQEWLNLSSTKSLIASLCSGSVRQSLKHADMESIPLVMPPPSVKTTFNEIYELFMESIRVRDQETQVLSDLRDTLLPKLISGELCIPDAENLVEEADI